MGTASDLREQQAAEMDSLKKKVSALLKEIDDLTRQLKLTRDVLIDTQEKNRQLDWLLTKAVEHR